MNKLSVMNTIDRVQLAEGQALLSARAATPDVPETLVRQACLVAEYTSYMAAAGYSASPSATAERSLGAWSFLSRFPQPEAFLRIPVVDQLRLPLREHNFIHYLFLRHVLPMPAAYALMSRAHLGDTARRLMECDTYQSYRAAALRLGYAEPTIRRQFQTLLCLMAWAQKSLEALSVSDVDAFAQAMKTAYQEMAGQGNIHVVLENGLPRALSQEISSLRRVLSHLGILPPVSKRRQAKRQKPARLTPIQQSRVLRQDATSPQACLVAEYTSYMAAVGYSTTPLAMTERSSGAWSFLRRFPQPQAWLELPLEQQVSLGSRAHQFLFYLFLRHLLPLPPGYILAASPKLGRMAMRLEQNSYQRYQEVARRLEYTEPTIKRQFEALLCLMSWSQKAMNALTGADLDAFADALIAASRNLQDRGGVLCPQDFHLGKTLPRSSLRCTQDGIPRRWSAWLQTIRQVLYHMGILSYPSSQHYRRRTLSERWQEMPENVADTVQRYLGQMAVALRPLSLAREESKLRRFFSWLASNIPEVTQVNQLRRCHIEAFKEYLRWASPLTNSHLRPRVGLQPRTVASILSTLRNFFCRLAEWEWPESPGRPLIFNGDFPRLDMPLPRFLEEPEAARFLQAARTQSDLFARVCGVTLLYTGLRKGEFLNLSRDCIVHIGEGYWLRVPLGKMHKERFVPLHAEAKQLLEEWTTHQCSDGILQHPRDFLFTSHGRRIGRGRLDAAVERIATVAGITSRVTPHRLRHTVATIAINHGMSLDSIADFLGHSSLSMTRIYARLSNRTLHNEYSAVSQRLEQLCGSSSDTPRRLEDSGSATASEVKQALSLPPSVEGPLMHQLRQEVHWRLLGNGYCTRPQGAPCDYESICESCPCFHTTPDFLPHLCQQKDDAASKGHSRRANVLDKLIHSLEVLH